MKKLKNHKEEIRRSFHVDHIGVFGSCARGEVQEASDVDVLVKFATNHETFDNYMEL
jgi:hypothetical protein